MLLDTNVYSAMAQGKPSVINTLSDATELSLPLPVIAELRYGFLKGSQRDRNERNLQRFLAQPNVHIQSPSLKTTELYAELQLHCVKQGRALSHSDIWIAAMAHETDSLLITYDQDFAAFANILGDNLNILR